MLSEIILGILSTLPELRVAESKERPGFLYQACGHPELHDVPLSAYTVIEHDVKFSAAKWRSHFVLDHPGFYP